MDIENLEDQVKSLETKKYDFTHYPSHQRVPNGPFPPRMESLSNLVEVSQDEVIHKLQNEVIIILI